MSIVVQFKDLPVARADLTVSFGRSRVKAREIVSAWAEYEFRSRMGHDQAHEPALLKFEAPRFANPNFAKQSALEGFKHGAFCLEVEGTRASDLDEEFILGPHSSITFLISEPVLAG
ncbi:MAG: hypothetical protein AAF441_15930 [Pseudomonadota bacterium]